MRRPLLILVFCLLAIPLAAASARAAGRPRVLLAQAMSRTDDRIAAAAATLNGTSRADAEAELHSARDLQTQARMAFNGARPRIAYDLTLEARDHADRAIALLRGVPDPDRVLAQLEQTRDGIDRAGESMRDCPDDRAQAQLHEAADMQGLAEAAARGDRYLAALQLTFGARERMLHALKQCGVVEDLPTTSNQAIERTDQVMARARLTLGAPSDDAAHQALRRAESMQAQALEQQRANRHDAAMRLTFGARASALKAMRLRPAHR